MLLASGVILMVVIVAALAARLLRSARTPAAPLVAGLLVGALLGPTILGRDGMFGASFSTWYEDTIIGGRAERETLEQARSGLGGLEFAARRTAAAPPRDEVDRLQRAVDLAAADHRAARMAHDRGFLPMICGLAAAILVLAGPLGRPRDPNAPPAGFMAPLSIGLWSAALPGALAYVWLRGVGADGRAAWLGAAAAAIGPWVLPAPDEQTSDEAEQGGAHLLELAGRVASVVAIIAAGVGFGFDHVGEWAVLLLLPIGWLLPRGRCPSGRTLAESVLIPGLTAAAMLRIDAIAHLWLGTSIVLILLTADGRWIAAALGAILGAGRRPLRALRLVGGSAAAGPTQMSVAALGVWTSVIAPPIALALLLGATWATASENARRWAAKELEATEEELAAIAAEDDEE